MPSSSRMDGGVVHDCYIATPPQAQDMVKQLRFSDVPPANAGELPIDFHQQPFPTAEYSEDGIPIYRTGAGEVIEDEHGEQALLSLIPLLSGSPLKAKYLSFRATGFSVMEACKLANVSHITVMRWRKTDEEFRDFELIRLPKLQGQVRSQILLLDMARIMKLAFYIDGKIFLKAANNLDLLDEREMEVFKMVRKHYTAESLITLEKALAPETDAILNAVPGTVTVIVNNRVVDSEAARKAGHMKLLADFTVNKDAAEELEDDSSDSD